MMNDGCPFCKSDLRGEEIPRESLEKGYYGPYSPDDPPRYFSRMIGIETEKYDGVSEWHCPDCGARWDRWTGKRLDVAPA